MLAATHYDILLIVQLFIIAFLCKVVFVLYIGKEKN